MNEKGREKFERDPGIIDVTPESIKTIPVGGVLVRREAKAFAKKDNKEDSNLVALKKIDMELARIYEAQGLNGLYEMLFRLETELGNAERLIRQAASFHPGAQKKVHELDDIRLDSERHPDSHVAKIAKVYQAIDEVTGGRKFFESLGAKRDSEGFIHVEGIPNRAFRVLFPMLRSPLVVGNEGKLKPGSAVLVFIDPREKKVLNVYPYFAIFQVGKYIIGKLNELGGGQSAHLIDPETGRVWFGKDGEYKDFVVAKGELWGVLKKPDQRGQEKIKVPDRDLGMS